MSGTRRTETLSEMRNRRVSAILRWSDTETARRAMRAAVGGGMRMIEFTMTTPGALELVAEFARDPDLLVGAGTVLSVGQAREAAAAGARFLVSPVVDPEVIAEASKLDAVAVPGTYTPTEMQAAIRAGADLLKLFPAPADIATYVSQILGPFPGFRIFPTAGVTPENFAAVLRAGAFGVGFVGSLFDRADMAAGNFEAIERRAAAIMKALAAL
jgi:2-dehydro-3-deoxyphosphogluconate aldolase/(4S)-4-hydroxy-2-oxoglutarate aldolase